jgi:serine kinase of HPr protein (carbohydrate metabolism regulator)
MEKPARVSKLSFPAPRPNLPDEQILHGTAVLIGAHGVLLTGKPGSGKSDLALRLIDRGAKLIADDGVKLIKGSSRPEMHATKKIAGLMEIRNLGILEFDHAPSAELYLCVQLDGEPERFPLEEITATYQGFPIPKIVINAFEVSAAIKVELALRVLAGQGVNDD